MRVLRKDDLFTAPAIEGATPPEEACLLELLEERKDLTGAILFSLGNVYFREQQLPQAVAAYQKALKQGEHQLELHTNLGLAYRWQNKLKKAQAELKRAVVISPTAFLPNYQLALLQIEQGKYEMAEGLLRTALSVEEQSSRAYLALGDLLLKLQRPAEALIYYEKSLSLEPENREVQTQLARWCFEEGRELYSLRGLSEAAECWFRGYKKYPAPFEQDLQILQGLSALAKEYKQSSQFAELCSAWEAAVESRAEDSARRLAYQLCLNFLFKEELLPGMFESADSGELGEAYWKKNLQDLGEHPFPHFRLGLLAFYQGKLELALEKFRYCEDKILPKKQASLKLKQLSRFVSERLARKTEIETGIVLLSPEEEWEAKGFVDPLIKRLWQQTALGPAEARAWLDAGLSPALAAKWAKVGFQPEVAARFIKEKVLDAAAARKWWKLGLEADQAGKWQSVFGEDLESALQCFGAGIREPESARQWLSLVGSPWNAFTWHEQGFTPDEARSWIERGLEDPFIAKRVRDAKRFREE